MNVMAWWLVLLVALIVIELITLGLTTIWFAGGALVATILAACGAPFYLQVAVFIVISVLLLFFTRPIAMKYFNTDRIKTNAESLIGQSAVVTSDISNLQSTGQVTVNGVEWMARTPLEEATIVKGTVVTILAISGAKLIVEERKEEK